MAKAYVCTLFTYFLQYELDESLVGHTDPVNCVAGIHHKSSKDSITTTIASSSSDFTVKIWQRDESSSERKFQLLQTLACGSGFVLGLDIHCVDDGHVILACGTDVGKVEIYAKQDDQVSPSILCAKVLALALALSLVCTTTHGL